MSATGNGSDTGAVVVPIKVEPELSGLDAMRAKLRGAQADVDALKTKASAPTYLEFQVNEAKANVKSLTEEIRELEKAQKKQAASNKLAVTGYKFQKANEAEDAAKVAGYYERAGDALSTGAGMAATAALAIAAAGVGLVAAGVKYGIENTAQRQKNQAVLDKLTRGQGVEAEEFSKSLAAETGVDEDKAMERVKALIQAKFGKEDTGAIFRASADIGEVKGEAKAELFLKTLEKVQFEGAATTRSLEALKGAGVDKGDLLEGLKRAGETTEQVEARLKSGKVAADEFARAAAAVVQKDIGGVAGKGLDAMINRLKIGFGDLFDDFDLGPIEQLGGLLSDALSGEDGAKLKAGLTEAGDAVLKLAKNITADDIKSAFASIASAASTMAKGVGEAYEFASETFKAWKEFSGANAAEGEDIERQIKLQTDKAQIRYEKEQKAKAAAEEAAKAKAAGAGAGPEPTDAAGAPALPGSVASKGLAKAGGDETGKAFADGMAKGVEENASKPAAAAAAAAAGMTAAGKDAIKSKSPSRVAEEQIGKTFDEGAELGITRNADKPAAAASRMMGRVVRAGAGGVESGAAGGLPGIGSGGVNGAGALSITNVFSPTVNVQGGAPDVGQQVDRALLAAYPGWLALQRQAQRDAQENRLPMVSQ